jgi:hypothetical protein
LVALGGVGVWGRNLKVALRQRFHDFLHARECPIQVFAFDDQGRGKAYDVFVRLFAQQALLFQRFTETPCAAGLPF